MTYIFMYVISIQSLTFDKSSWTLFLTERGSVFQSRFTFHAILIYEIVTGASLFHRKIVFHAILIDTVAAEGIRISHTHFVFHTILMDKEGSHFVLFSFFSVLYLEISAYPNTCGYGNCR